MGRYGKVLGRGKHPLFGIVFVAGVLFWAASNFTFAARESNIRQTPHNLSASGPGTAKATSENQICVFCHTPHAATAGVGPLWNKTLSSATYTTYTSSTLDSGTIQGGLAQPGGSSKLCLSCHDGTLAVGNVNVLNGKGSLTTGTIAIATTGYGTGGTMPTGDGVTTGFTRNLGTNLTNDHPISVTLNAALAAADGEIRAVDANQRFPATTGATLGVRGKGYHPKLPLEPVGPQGAGQIQCATCHDPHIRETDATMGNQKFLRLNRFQEAAPTGNYNQANDIICLTCHDRDQGTGTWAFSVHANPNVANSTYTAAAATTRQFPANLPVWKAACLNCHDTHTVQGARRLLREGTDSTASPKAGGNSAIEQTCYQCHTTTAARVVNPPSGEGPPNIASDFNLPRRMPIVQSPEAHDISSNFTDSGFGSNCSSTGNTKCGKDFLEPRTLLGAGGNLNNRHVECTDCHNPHRVMRFRSIVGNNGNISVGSDPEATHPHTASTMHTNIASGALRGIWGVEPTYPNTSFFSNPSSFTVKRGDPGSSSSTAVTQPYLTREYQLCLKCHSNYGYDDNNTYPTGNRPNLGASTPSGSNNFNGLTAGLTQYTNQAREFQAPASHQGEGTKANSGASANFGGNNHRSWHPVMDITGRTGLIRGNNVSNISGNWTQPWSNNVGNQTMYCTDCHGSNVSSSGTVIPDGGANGNVWGPHGSTNDFLLKGAWDACTGTSAADISTGAGMGGGGGGMGGGGMGGMGTAQVVDLGCNRDTRNTDICFKCHNYDTYANPTTAQRTGFYITPVGMAMCMGAGGGMGGGAPIDGHLRHRQLIGRMHCSWCHVAVPHGWKNKALLVNLNDVGPEAGLAAGTQVKNNTLTPYNQQPYYMNAHLKVINFRTSGQWLSTDCGSAGAPGNGQVGVAWMANSNEACVNAP